MTPPSASPTLPALQRTFVNVFFESARGCGIEKWRDLFGEFSVVSVSQETKHEKSLKTWGGGNSELQTGQFGTKFGNPRHCCDPMYANPLPHKQRQQHYDRPIELSLRVILTRNCVAFKSQDAVRDSNTTDTKRPPMINTLCATEFVRRFCKLSSNCPLVSVKTEQKS